MVDKEISCALIDDLCVVEEVQRLLYIAQVGLEKFGCQDRLFACCLSCIGCSLGSRFDHYIVLLFAIIINNNINCSKHMLASADQVKNHLLGRLIDPSGDLIFSNDYSYITCAVCESLLSAEGSPMTCQCGASIVCLGC